MTDNELAIERLKDIKTKVESIGDSVALDIAISALKPTCKIDESNFSMEQYKIDLQSAYDCGKAEALKGEWIPVSERLPEKDMACLVAVGLLNLTQLAMYSDLMGVIDHRIFYQGDVGHDSFEDITEYVKAWQPLPEAYKGESEDKE